MKNTIKMSLVAALAVAGLSTTASAGALEDAIKGVSISGKMEVEYENHKEDTNGAASATLNGNANNMDYDIDVTAKIPVNDMITATVGLQADDETSVEAGPAGDNGNAQVDVSSLYFTYANGPITAMVGKQGMAGSPWFDDEKGHGVVALYNAGVATIAAAHYTGVGTVGADRDIAVLAAMGSIGPVNAKVWYADISKVADSFVIEADAKFDIVNVGVKYGQADYELAANGGLAGVVSTNDEAEMLQISVSADLGVATPWIAYGSTGDQNGNSNAGLDLTGDTDSRIDFGGEILSIDDLADADAFALGVTVPMNEWKFSATYIDGDYAMTATTEGDFDETIIDVEYKVSKNFTIDAYYATAELQTAAATTVESDTMEIALEYKF